ncbi:MAG: hypothetical protein E6073_03960 [Anaerococcus vaginalis]|nr:hypothetical protein [Anaerococcus vaginalis]
MKNLIILAGYPATGKTCIINSLIEHNKNLEYISIDEIEEFIYDNLGFKNKEEKKKIYNLSFEFFYMKLNSMMSENKDIVIDYPFSYLQYPTLKELSFKYDYKSITIRLNGDIEEIYKRRVKRDLDESRNPAHLLNSYDKNKKVSLEERKDNLISLEEFIKHCRLREYDKFELGKLLEIDVTKKYADVDAINRFLDIEMRT